MASSEGNQRILNGINASPGICIGKAYLVDKEGVDIIERYYIEEKKRPNEIKRFKAAVKRAKDELRKIIDQSPKEFQNAHILETHMVLLKDKMLYGRAVDTIKNDGFNAEWALKTVVSGLRTMFQNMEDPYLRERSADIIHVSDRIMRNLMGAEAVNIASINKRVILVAHDLSPADTSQINLERIKGFITDLGGKASHTGIIARTLEIPAVVGLETATSQIHNDDVIIVDGNLGQVIINPDEATLIEYEERKVSYEEHRAIITRESALPAETLDGCSLEVMANIELPEEVVAAINYGSDGIGLYRTEFQYFNRMSFPDEEELFDKYKDVVEVMAPKPVTIRTLDINADKSLSYNSFYEEANPALGLRAIRYCLRKPEIFKAQLRAILRAAAFGNVRIMFPMISTYFEVCEAIDMLDIAAESLQKDGLPFRREIDIGAMIEVPSAVIMADRIAEKVDFFSIGTNDLIQYSLAIDRGNRQVAHLYQPLDPAIIRMLNSVAHVAEIQDVEVYMCGEMAGTPHHVPLLLGMGIHELSMNPQSIPDIKRVIRLLNAGDTHALLQEALEQTTAKAIFEIIRSNYGPIFKDQETLLGS